MRRTREIIGLPVVCLQSGKQAGEVKDLLFDPEWNIREVVLETKHWFSAVVSIAAPDIHALGRDAVMIDSEEVIRPLPEISNFRSISCGDDKLKGMPVLTVNGQELGIVEDVYLGQNQGIHVVGYELSDGFLADLKEGRKWLPIPVEVTAGEDALIVPADAIDTMQDIFEPKEE